MNSSPYFFSYRCFVFHCVFGCVYFPSPLAHPFQHFFYASSSMIISVFVCFLSQGCRCRSRLNGKNFHSKSWHWIWSSEINVMHRRVSLNGSPTSSCHPNEKCSLQTCCSCTHNKTYITHMKEMTMKKSRNEKEERIFYIYHLILARAPQSQTEAKAQRLLCRSVV